MYLEKSHRTSREDSLDGISGSSVRADAGPSSYGACSSSGMAIVIA